MGQADDGRARRGPRFEDIVDQEFQRKWLDARTLTGEQVDVAFRHGFEAGDRFAERPFDEIADHLRESWHGMGSPAPWQEVQDIVRSGYEHAEGGTQLGPVADAAPDALDRFPSRTIGGSAKSGTMGETAELGASEPASDYDGEGGRPVGGEEAVDTDAGTHEDSASDARSAEDGRQA